MPPLPDPSSPIAKRLYYSGNWGGARWAFFAIFIVVIIICILGTIRVNKARSRQGIQPIYGTRWMTPPSYFQSQGQYNQPTRRDPEMPNAYVPTYTERANDNDMGHYDPEGVFHANPNAKGPLMPEASHNRTSSNADGYPLSDLNRRSTTVNDEGQDDSLFRRPSGPPPSLTRNPDADVRRPEHPPP